MTLLTKLITTNSFTAKHHLPVFYMVYNLILHFIDGFSEKKHVSAILVELIYNIPSLCRSPPLIRHQTESS